MLIPVLINLPLSMKIAWNVQQAVFSPSWAKTFLFPWLPFQNPSKRRASDYVTELSQ